MLLYFIKPESPFEKFDLYWMKELKDSVHLIPIIGKADSKREKDMIEFKWNLTSAAYLNDIPFFDVNESLNIKLKGYGENILNYFLEDKNGPCPPFWVTTFSDFLSGIDENGKEYVKYGREFKWGTCSSLDDNVSDLWRVWKTIIMIGSHTIKTTDQFTGIITRELSSDSDEQVRNFKDKFNI